jgi:hypothetical protein
MPWENVFYIYRTLRNISTLPSSDFQQYKALIIRYQPIMISSHKYDHYNVVVGRLSGSPAVIFREAIGVIVGRDNIVNTAQ